MRENELQKASRLASALPVPASRQQHVTEPEGFIAPIQTSFQAKAFVADEAFYSQWNSLPILTGQAFKSKEIKKKTLDSTSLEHKAGFEDA